MSEPTKKMSTYNPAYYATHRDKRLASSSAYQKAHPEKGRTYAATYKKTHPEQKRRAELRRKYGITLEDFCSRLAKQGDVCASCGESNWGRNGPVIDHNHATGKVCGILCNNCNVASGMMADDSAKLKKLIIYLERVR